MKRALALALLLGGCGQADDFAFQNTSIVLPDDTVTLPATPGHELVTQNCTACHSPSQMLTQPRLTRAQWFGIVEKMGKVYKAQVPPEEVPAIVDYLVRENARVTDAK